MASGTAYDLFKAAVQAHFAGLYAVLDADEVSPQTVQQTEPYVVLFDLDADEQLLSVGSPDQACFLENGIMGVSLYIPTDSTYVDGRKIIDAMRDALRFRTLGPGAQMRITNCQPANPTKAHNGLWTELSVDCEFEHRFHRAIA